MCMIQCSGWWGVTCPEKTLHNTSMASLHQTVCSLQWWMYRLVLCFLFKFFFSVTKWFFYIWHLLPLQHANTFITLIRTPPHCVAQQFNGPNNLKRPTSRHDNVYKIQIMFSFLQDSPHEMRVAWSPCIYFKYYFAVDHFSHASNKNLNPLNPEKNPIVGFPTLSLQTKNHQNLFSNCLLW